MQFEELLAAQLADVVITHSHAEAALLRSRLPGARVAVVPWAVPLRASTTGFAERDGVVFVGDFAHSPNADAVHRLAPEIVPLVQARDPEICCRVAGNNMPESLRRLARPGLEMIGAVETVDALFERARLTVAPLRYGAGVKAKVVESLAAGVPCVGTAVAFEGMNLPPAVQECIADTPEGLAAAVAKLYRDEAAHAAVAQAGRRYALVTCGEANVDALMQQAMAPALHRWAGIAGEALAAA